MKKKTVTVLAIEYSKGCVILNLNLLIEWM